MLRPVPARIRAARKVGYALLDLHPEVLAETYVAFNHVAHVANLVAEHEGAFVDHAAAAPLDPAGAALGARMPDIELRGRLGEREIVGAQPDLGFRTEHLACEVLQR